MSPAPTISSASPTSVVPTGSNGPVLANEPSAGGGAETAATGAARASGTTGTATVLLLVPAGVRSRSSGITVTVVGGGAAVIAVAVAVGVGVLMLALMPVPKLVPGPVQPTAPNITIPNITPAVVRWAPMKRNYLT